jgi:hypothetical protein
LRGSKYVTLQLLWEEYRQGNPEGYRYLPTLQKAHFGRVYRRDASASLSNCPPILHPVALRQLDLLSYRGSDLVHDPQQVASCDIALHHDLPLNPFPADEIGAPILVDVGDGIQRNLRRVGVHPKVLEETARVSRQRLGGEIAQLREELNGVQLRVKNLKSQPARMRQSDTPREADLKEQIGSGEARTAELKREIMIRERTRLDEKELRKTMESFEELWKTMNIQEQSLLLRQLIEKVGYDGRTGKVTVSFKSASIKELCQK